MLEMITLACNGDKSARVRAGLLMDDFRNPATERFFFSYEYLTDRECPRSIENMREKYHIRINKILIEILRFTLRA